MNYEHYKRVVIREELFILTEHWLSALILGQFIYWSERTGEFDKFLEEEYARLEVPDEERIAPTSGWIYKSTKQLKDELMVDISESTIRRRIKQLVESAWLHERTNPRVGWDRTLQYRPDLEKILFDLAVIGYILPGYKLKTAKMQELFEQIASFTMKDALCTVKNGGSTVKNGTVTVKEHYQRLQQRVHKDYKEGETSSTKDHEPLSKFGDTATEEELDAYHNTLLKDNGDEREQKAEQHKQRTLDAINNGARNHTDMRDRWYNCFLSRPNWDTKTNAKFLRFLIERDKAGQPIEQFAEWWNSDDWRKDKMQTPSTSKVKEWWPQAFDKPSGREKLEELYPNKAGAYD